MIVGVNRPGDKFASYFRGERGLHRALRVSAGLREPRPILILRRADDLGAWAPASAPLLRRGFRIVEVQGARYLATIGAVPTAEHLEDRVGEALALIGRGGSTAYPFAIRERAAGLGLLLDVVHELGSFSGHAHGDYSDASPALVEAVAGRGRPLEYAPTPPTWRRVVGSPW